MVEWNKENGRHHAARRSRTPQHHITYISASANAGMSQSPVPMGSSRLSEDAMSPPTGKFPVTAQRVGNTAPRRNQFASATNVPE